MTQARSLGATVTSCFFSLASCVRLITPRSGMLLGCFPLSEQVVSWALIPPSVLLPDPLTPSAWPSHSWPVLTPLPNVRTSAEPFLPLPPAPGPFPRRCIHSLTLEPPLIIILLWYACHWSFFLCRSSSSARLGDFWGLGPCWCLETCGLETTPAQKLGAKFNWLEFRQSYME